MEARGSDRLLICTGVALPAEGALVMAPNMFSGSQNPDEGSGLHKVGGVGALLGREAAPSCSNESIDALLRASRLTRKEFASSCIRTVPFFEVATPPELPCTRRDLHADVEAQRDRENVRENPGKDECERWS